MERRPDRLRQHPPDVRPGPGDVDEVGQRHVRPRFPDVPRRQIQVVVVEEHRRVGLAFELGERRVREGPVDGDVAPVPGVIEALVDVRGVGEPPEVVLEKPERRVRDDVVEPVVGRRVVSNEPQAVRRPVARDLFDRLSAGLDDDGAVLLGHRARDPRHVVMRDEAAQGSDEPAAAAPGHAFALFVARERGGTAVRDDDQPSALSHRAGP